MCDTCDQTAKYNDNRKFRYEMLNTASGLLRKVKNKKGIFVNHRIATCSKHVPLYGKGAALGGILISKNEQGRAYLSGVGVCSNVWGCPVCAEKIGSKRAVEVSTAMSRHVVENKGWGLFLTLTFSHKKKDKLLNILDRQSKASQEMRNSRPFKDAMQQLGYIGSIKALEVTNGQNGWHPHTHEVMFINRALTPQELMDLKNVIYNQWAYYCEKNHLGKPNYSGVDIQVPHNIDAMCDYVGKWGYELTHLNIKHGKNGSRTPFQILSDLTKKYSFRDHMLYEEFVMSFKGKKQLRWSQGLKKLFGIDDKSDKLLNEAPEKEIITVIPKKDWYNIVAANQRAEILEIAENGGAEAVKQHLAKIADIFDVIRRRKSIEQHYQKRHERLADYFTYSTLPQINLNSRDTEQNAMNFEYENLNIQASKSRQLFLIENEEKNLMQKYASNMWKRENPQTVRQLIYN